jgi:ubiquinol-cytochrome c reductase cytochrome c1 subunit
MRTETAKARMRIRTTQLGLSAWALLALGALVCLPALAEESATSWEEMRAGTRVNDTTSLQHGARNFVGFCLGCHSLQFQRWSRLGTDLKIPPAAMQDLMPPGADVNAYMLTPMPPVDAAAWFGKTPPDLSLMVRARGKDYVYQFLKTFYVDPSRPTGANNLRLPSTAMPSVLSDLEGPKQAVFKKGAPADPAFFDHFQQLAPGRMTPAEYDTFVRDTVNFLDYVSEPVQMERTSVGIWVVLFLLAFTWIAWLLKKEYWKDVH